MDIQNSRSAKVTRATDQTLTTGTATPVSFSTAAVNPNGLWASGSPTKLTVDKPGLYLISGGVRWAAGSTGLRTLQVQVNGTSGLFPLQVSQAAPASGTGLQQITGLVRLTTSDYIELVATHSEGGNLAISADTTAGNPFFSICLVAPEFDYQGQSERA